MIDDRGALDHLAEKRVLVTGARGSIGGALYERLNLRRGALLATDLTTMDVRLPGPVYSVLREFRPDVVFHCAAAKHAPQGEDDPWEVACTNIDGTRNLIEGCKRYAPGARIVTASTCKACDPETAYGASKLIAERMTLNADNGAVARFYNVAESSGNVFRIWEELPASSPLPVSPCSRYFISIHDAVTLLLWSAVLPRGRYSVEVSRDDCRPMLLVAAETWPGRAVTPIAPRRGDRIEEPMLGTREAFYPTTVDGIVRVESPHDPDYDDFISLGDFVEHGAYVDAEGFTRLGPPPWAHT